MPFELGLWRRNAEQRIGSDDTCEALTSTTPSGMPFTKSTRSTRIVGPHRFSETMDKVTLALEAEGRDDIDSHFKFVPLDVAGHILCPLEWTADKRITASIPPRSPSRPPCLWCGRTRRRTFRTTASLTLWRSSCTSNPVRCH